MGNSKLLRALVIPAAVLLVIFLVTNPIGWITSGVIVSLFITKLILAGITIASAAIYSYVNREQIKFEMGYWKRYDNFHTIIEVDGRKLILGTLPNFYHFSKGEQALGEKATILSINSDWERERRGLSIPYTDKDWHDRGHAIGKMSVPDHTLLTEEQLDQAADYIFDRLKSGNVYVHCKAGESRSAAAVAGGLMKHGNADLDGHYTIEEICAHIKKRRPNARIWHKASSLVDYDKTLQGRPERSGEIEQLAENQRAGKKTSKQVDKLSADRRREITPKAAIDPYLPFPVAQGIKERDGLLGAS